MVYTLSVNNDAVNRAKPAREMEQRGIELGTAEFCCFTMLLKN